MGEGHGIAHKINEIVHDLFDQGLAEEHLIGNAGEIGDRFGQWNTRIDQRLKKSALPVFADAHRADLYDFISFRVQTRCFQVYNNPFHIRYSFKAYYTIKPRVKTAKNIRRKQ